jgi:type III restriction enzyme
VERSVYDHIVTDSPGVERQFAKALDDDPDVKLFFKLPDSFKIDTPLGTYNPDWAVLLNDNGTARLYFVWETKGSTRTLDFRGQENIKIECGRRHFEALGTVDYAVTDDWKKIKLDMALFSR